VEGSNETGELLASKASGGHVPLPGTSSEIFRHTRRGMPTPFRLTSSTQPSIAHFGVSILADYDTSYDVRFPSPARVRCGLSRLDRRVPVLVRLR
jgi:hypothetical protein